MSFTKIGFFTLSPSQRIRWGVLANGGQDFGAQYVGGDPETPGSLIVNDQTKVRFDDGQFEYDATFINGDTARPVSFSMQGGGFN